MKNITKILMLLIFVFAVGCTNLMAQTYMLQEDFSSITSGNSTSTSGSGTTWAGNTNFPTVTSSYEAGGVVKIGTSKAVGSITSKALNLSVNNGNFSVSFDVKGWTTVEGNITVTVTGLTAQTATYSATMADKFENIVLNFTGGTANSTVNIATSAKRAFIDNVNVYYLTPVATPAFNIASGTFSTPQNITISNGSSTDKIYYTLDGSAPSKNSTLYSGAINITSTTTVKAIAYDQNNANPSAVATAVYTINTPTITLTEIDIPAMSANVSASDMQNINVAGINLTDVISMNITGTDSGLFSVNPASISNANGLVPNTLLTVTYTPTTVGNHSAVLEIKTTGVNTVSKVLTGTCLSTGVAYQTVKNISVDNGVVKFEANNGESIEVYNSSGQCVFKGVTQSGRNTVELRNITGVAILKVGQKSAKIVL